VFCLKAILDLTEDNLQSFYHERPKVNFLVMSALLVLVVSFLDLLLLLIKSCEHFFFSKLHRFDIE
jgi:hypothetical protein